MPAEEMAPLLIKDLHPGDKLARYKQQEATMKALLTFAAALALGTGLASAQSLSPTPSHPVTTSAPSTARDVTGFSANNAPAINPDADHSFPNIHPDLNPRAGGIFVDGGKYGTILISPTAPAEYGIGEKYLAAPNARYDLEHESGPAAHRDAGGLKLLSLEF